MSSCRPLYACILGNVGFLDRVTVTVRHIGKVLHTPAISMSGTAASIASEIEKLADWIAERHGSFFNSQRVQTARQAG